MTVTAKDRATSVAIVTIGVTITRITVAEAEMVPNGIAIVIVFEKAGNGMTGKNGTESIHRPTMVELSMALHPDITIRTVTTPSISSTTNSCDVLILRRMPNGIARTTAKCRPLRCSGIC